MFETGLSHLAGTHTIAATPNFLLGCEFFQARYYLSEDPLSAPIPVRDGNVVVPDGPGLGIEVDEDWVRKYTVWRGCNRNMLGKIRIQVPIPVSGVPRWIHVTKSSMARWRASQQLDTSNTVPDT